MINMTLRDYFAGQAVLGLSKEHYMGVEGLATEAYDIADALLEEKTKSEASMIKERLK